MRSFFRILDAAALAALPEEDRVGLADALPHTLELERAIEDLESYHQKSGQWGDLLAWFHEHPASIRLVQAALPEEPVLLDTANRILYVRDFFYHTLVGKILREFHLYAAFQYALQHGAPPDAAIDLYGDLDAYLEARRGQLSEEEFATLSLDDAATHRSHALALMFVARVRTGSFQRTCALEKKAVRDLLGTCKAKQLLGLDESAYRYLETPGAAGEQVEREREICRDVAAEFEARKLAFEDYVHQQLPRKNLLLWIWWTISPFVAADVSILLPMIYELKKVRKIYIDLARESQPVIDDYLAGKAVTDEQLEEEIRRIYPPVLETFQKETLPYHVLLEKIRDFGIPVECFGFNGAELMEMEPLLGSDNRLHYPPDRAWRRLFYGAYQERMSADHDDLEIFIHFMKPMFTLPPGFSDERFERIIHVDKFTGFGPKKPENRLSCYSRHAPRSQKSFVLTPLSDSSLAQDAIVYFPFMDDPHMPRLDDRLFNRFGCYQTLIYSSHSGGGGRGGKEEFVPVNSFTQPVF
ncbi:MAG: hypothetical protein J0L75_04745 [Spirochaetes bacterium]|nr:hypothetical protein [Spirochaetota bacterium]